MSTAYNHNERTTGSWTQDRRANLTQKIAYLAIAVCSFYFVFDYLSGAVDYLPFYLILLFGSIICLVLLKYGQDTLAKAALLISGMLLLSIFASWETRETGVFMYFLVVALGAVTLFGPEDKWVAFGIGLTSFLLFYIIYFTDWIAVERIDLSEEYISASLLINYTICLIATITMVYYLLTIGQRYENRARKTEASLLELARELEQSKKKFELAIEGSSAGIWDWDFDKKKLYISPQMMKMLGFGYRERDNLEEKEFTSYLHPDDKERVTKALKKHLEKKKRFELECRLRKKDGTYIWVLDTGQAEWDINNSPMRMVGSIVDITERKRAEKELFEKNIMLTKTNEELDRFVYSTSHDLKAPLSSVLGLITLTEMSQDPRERDKCLHLMRSRIETLNGFIADIISYSRNTRLEVVYEEVVLKQMIEAIFQNLEHYSNCEKIVVSYDFDDTLVLKTDKGRLRVIFNNLLSNAIKYHDIDKKEPAIKIKAKQGKRYLQIDFIDNGQGIASENLDQIFNMFYRASESSEGSGLGLYIAKEMTEKLEGKLLVESHLGEGSKFTLKLPLKK